ncbi:hypothetical protein ANCDUO_05728 [Ancylostoma duodenale]|uniref:Uncharacterized protein n=1 Tax=Ancylostoma duodenale TaxID=51022 RepID=A0A0C2H3G6_9BILA|nr:hypothetical protein ANCDUO_05728 [Ancylostoma duodenale]
MGHISQHFFELDCLAPSCRPTLHSQFLILHPDYWAADSYPFSLLTIGLLVARDKIDCVLN